MDVPKTAADGGHDAPALEPRAPWEPPRFEVISLCCEITAYAPDDDPLF